MTTEAGTPFESRGSPLARALQPARTGAAERTERLERLHAYFLEGCPDEVRPALDGGNKVADALRIANAARARRPQLPVVIAADTGGKSPTGVRVFDRWNETEELLLDIERLLAEPLPAPVPIGAE
jgi:hypothetical protein